MKVVFCGGGTGGHVYPALTVAAALRRLYGDAHPLDLLYLGVRGRIDRDLVAREDIPFRAITAGPLRVGNVVGTLKGVARLIVGFGESYGVLRSFRPDVVFSTGGYGSVGVGLAARARNVPLVLFLPDVEPGLAVKTLVRVAKSIAVTVPRALDAMPASRTRLTGYPVRPAFFTAERAVSRQALGLHPTLPLLLVAGGSTGASVINRQMTAWLPEFLRVGQVLHVSGPGDEQWLRQHAEALPPDLRERYHLRAYLHEGMDQAMAAADLAVMRAGASTLGELPATRLPAILIPGVFSDQSLNARYLEEQGAAVTLSQDRLEDLYDTIMQLMGDSSRRESMKQALAQMSHANAADDLARLVAETAGVREGAAV